MTDGHGVPLTCIISEANRTDMKRLGALLDAQLVEAPAQTDADGQSVPRDLTLDRGYDYDVCRELARAQGYRPHIPPKASAAQPLPPPGDPARHPARRWVVERTQPHYPPHTLDVHRPACHDRADRAA